MSRPGERRASSADITDRGQGERVEIVAAPHPRPAHGRAYGSNPGVAP